MTTFSIARKTTAKNIRTKKDFSPPSQQKRSPRAEIRFLVLAMLKCASFDRSFPPGAMLWPLLAKCMEINAVLEVVVHRRAREKRAYTSLFPRAFFGACAIF